MTQINGLKQNRYSIRKLSIGVASVAISCLWLSSQGVLAAEVSDEAFNVINDGEANLPDTGETVADEQPVSHVETLSIDMINEKMKALNEEIAALKAEMTAGSVADAAASEVAAGSYATFGEETASAEEGEVTVADDKAEGENAENTTVFVRNATHVGPINNIHVHADQANVFDITYETGQKGRVSIYSDSIIRYYVTQDGNFQEVPDPSREDRPATIITKQLRDFAQLTPTFEETADTYVIKTAKAELVFSKALGTMKIINLTNNKVVVEEVEPLSMAAGATVQTLKAGENSQYFGGGTQNGRFTHKGEAINIVNENNWVDGGVASPNPFYWTTDGYGVVRNTFKPGVYDFQRKDTSKVTTKHNENRFDAFYLIDEKPVDILKDYYQLTGAPVVLPIFALYEGHLNAYNRDYWVEVPAGTPGAVYFKEMDKWYREYQPSQLGDRQGVRESLNGKEDPSQGDLSNPDYAFTARAVIDRYAAMDMPLGWFVSNDGYGAGYGQTGSLEGNIENLRRFSEYAREHGVESGLWTQSDLSPQPGVEPLLQRDLVNEVAKGLARVLKTDVAWVGPGYSFGLNGVSNVAEIISANSDNARPFIISLDGWAGTQAYAGIWTGDQTGGQWEYIRFHIPTYIGTGLSGNPNVSSDMDGIFGGGNKIINIRDFQWKAFTTMQLNMDGWGSNPKNPFAFDDTTTDINRSYLKLKSRLVPYSYSVNHEARTGLPIVRAMFLEFPDEAINYTKDVQYQYMYGPNFLVAPVYENVHADAAGNDVRNGIYLPKGSQWIDYYTGEIYEGGQVLNNYDAPIWKLPVFVRNGAIIPVTAAHNNYKQIDKAMREVDFYPHEVSTFTLTEDDGTTQEYLDGKIAKTTIHSVEAAGDVTLTVGRTSGSYTGFEANKHTQFNVNLTKQPKTVSLFVNGAEVTLKAVDSLEAFNAGENVYFYDATPNLNKYSYAGAYKDVEINKNPVLRVKTAKLDVTQNEIQLKLASYENNNMHASTMVENSQTPPTIAAKDAETTPTSVTVAWNAVDGATSYDLLVDNTLYTNIKDTTYTHTGLNYESSHTYKVRAVSVDSHTAWSNEIHVTTKADPYRLAISDIRISTNREAQNGQGFDLAVDHDTSTQFHTDWNSNAIPADIVLDLNASYKLDHLEYVPRNDGGRNGMITNVQVLVSNDYKHWQDASGELSWAATPEHKAVNLTDKEARYVWLRVTGAVGNFVSGQEIFVFKKDGTSGRLVGDISNDGVIDANDITSLRNYAGLRKDIDNDYAGYVEPADLNMNGLIDAYDIYFVNKQLGEGDSAQETTATGELYWQADKKNPQTGEEVVYTLVGKQLANVAAINANLKIDTEKYEVLGNIQVNRALTGMTDFSKVRLHSDKTQEAFVILANDKTATPISGDLNIATLRLRVKAAGAKALRGEDLFVVGSDLQIVNSTGEANAENQVPTGAITVTGKDAVYQEGAGVDKLNDGDLNSLTELKWDWAPNHDETGKLPADVTLPQDITFTFNDGLTNISRIEVHKRANSNGTVTKVKLVGYKDGAVVYESGDVQSPIGEERVNVKLDNPIEMDKLVLTVLEARNAANTVTNQMMTLREVKFFSLPVETDPGEGEGGAGTTDPDPAPNPDEGGEEKPAPNPGEGGEEKPAPNPGEGSEEKPAPNPDEGGEEKPAPNPDEGGEEKPAPEPDEQPSPTPAPDNPAGDTTMKPGSGLLPDLTPGKGGKGDQDDKGYQPADSKQDGEVVTGEKDTPAKDQIPTSSTKEDVSKVTSDKLPQTGAMVGAGLTLGLSLMGIGSVFSFRRKQ